MKKIAILAIAIGLLISSCLPAPATDIPAPSVDLDATAAIFVQQTLQALPSMTTAPTNTPVVVITTTFTATPFATITSTGTLPITSTSTIYGLTQTTNTNAPSTTPALTSNTAATETLHARFYGTLPPNVAYNSIELVNRSKAQAYISLQVTVADGSTTILEYPVGGLFSVQAPVGKYKYVAWVGGKKMTGSFTLDKNNDLRITIYKDHIEIKKR